MISKKAQQEIIVTVLLVLIALAAVAAVATFVINNVKKSTAGADDKLACAKIELDITSAVAGGTSINVQRLGSADATGVVTKVNVINDGVITAANAKAIAAGETQSITTTALVKGKTVEAFAILANGYICPAAASETVA